MRAKISVKAGLIATHTKIRTHLDKAEVTLQNARIRCAVAEANCARFRNTLIAIESALDKLEDMNGKTGESV